MFSCFSWCSVCIISHKVIRKTKCNRQEERKITKEENAPFCHELCKKKNQKSKIRKCQLPINNRNPPVFDHPTNSHD